MTTVSKTTTPLSLGPLLLGAAVGLSGLLGGTPARAQDAEPVQKPATIKLGVFLPTNGTLKDAVGKTWFTAGADYAFSKSGPGAGLMPLAYVDYAGKSAHGLSADYVGVGPAVRFYTSPPGTSTTTPYLGAGVGAYFLRASGNGVSDNKTRVGFKVDAGIEFQQAYLLEVNYTNAGSLEGTRFDGVGIQAGLRF